MAISIAVYGRIFLSQFFNLPDNELLYTDTDSLFLSKPLPPEYLGNNLGYLKLEHICDQIYVINPKVYLLIFNNGNLISKTAGFNFHFTPSISANLLNYNSQPLSP